MLIKVFILLAAGILGWSQAQDGNAADRPYSLPKVEKEVMEMPHPTEVLHKGIYKLHIDTSFKDYLRHPSLEKYMPTIISFDIECLTDGWHEMRTVGSDGELHVFTTSGLLALNSIMVDEVDFICGERWEDTYGSSNDSESGVTWYF